MYYPIFKFGYFLSNDACKSDRSHRELSYESLLPKTGVDTAEKEPLEVADSAAGENTELVVNRLLKADLASIPGEIAASKPASLKLSGTET